MNEALAVTLTIGDLRTLVREAVREEVTVRESAVMTREDVAKFLRVTEKTVTTYVERDGLPANKLGPNQWRFFRAEVVAWMKGRK